MHKVANESGLTGSEAAVVVHEREIEFHNFWANSTSVGEVLVTESFESPLAPENRYALHLMGNLKDKKVLDVATGLGEAAVYFALQGADVTATDLSPEMVNHASQLALHHQTNITPLVCPAEKLDLPDNEFDICYAANLLHHVTNRRQTLLEMRRVLKPDGLLVTWDPLAYNPIINIYRRMADKVRTEDEQPLTFKVIQEFEELFVEVGHREFWLSALSIFLKYYLVDGVHPNEDRYWKRILKEGPSTMKWLGPLLALDQRLFRLKPFNYLAWTIFMHGRKPS